jgi:hypothetical protein
MVSFVPPLLTTIQHRAHVIERNYFTVVFSFSFSLSHGDQLYMFDDDDDDDLCMDFLTMTEQ